MSADCPQTEWLSGTETMRAINVRALRERIPLSGSIEITQRCNLRCRHCYLEAESRRGARPAGRELGTGAWRRLLDEITEAQCLNLLITGGEPLLRRDFREIYRHARENGLIVGVFTNATLISDAVMDLFEELPPRHVEVSLYGATAETYEKVTGVPGSFRRCIEGVERMLARGMPVRAKTMLMTVNRHEFEQIEAMAKAWGVPFRHDAALFPRFSGDRAPLDWRLSAAEAVAIEMSDPARLADWARFYTKVRNFDPGRSLYTCGAGMVAFHVDSAGALRPCLMVDHVKADISAGGFERAWREVIPQIRDAPAPEGFGCHTCPSRVFCGYCPAVFELETGAQDRYAPYLCEMGHLRARAVARFLEEPRDERERAEREEAGLREAGSA